MNTKCWSIRFYTTGYYNLKLSAAIRAGNSNAGPRNFSLGYRIGNGNWISIPNSAIICNNAWTGGVYNGFTLPATLANLPDMVELRWIMTSDTSINGSLVLPAGVCKIDNIFVTGDIDTYVKDMASPIIHLFPNPNNGRFMLSCPIKSQWQLVNLYGQIMKDGIAEENQTMDISELPIGIYILRVENKGKSEVLRVVRN